MALKAIRYKGYMTIPAMRDYLIGRITLQYHNIFSQQWLAAALRYGDIKLVPAIKQNPQQCARCLTTKLAHFITFDCARCAKKCVYCRNCIQMGRVTSCEPLVIWQGQEPKYNKKILFTWQGQLTKAQNRAAKQMLTSLDKSNNHVLHAVCGSGKTEILLPVIARALERGMRVAIATPRTDVVLELAPRLRQVFPNSNCHALYGGAPKQYGYAPLIITTTHQLYRFQNAFDLLIVDEADAFPYTFDKTLQLAVAKARKSNAPTMLVTATPSSQILQQMKKEQWGYSYLARRYHGFALPVPRMQAVFGCQKQLNKEKLPKKIMLWVQNCLHNKQPFLLFFPSVRPMQQALPLMQKLHADIESVHASDMARKEKVLKLRNEQYVGLLTTTILERGITIKNVQVAVINAESSIFDAGALIQISGRVGRNKNFATGDVVFFHEGLTLEMLLARNTILACNKEEIYE